MTYATTTKAPADAMVKADTPYMIWRDDGETFVIVNEACEHERMFWNARGYDWQKTEEGK